MRVDHAADRATGVSEQRLHWPCRDPKRRLMRDFTPSAVSAGAEAVGPRSDARERRSVFEVFTHGECFVEGVGVTDEARGLGAR